MGDGLFPMAAHSFYPLYNPTTGNILIMKTNPPPLDVPGLLRSYELRPNKRLGQNFLIDDTYLRKIVEISGISSEDSILEIGPGLGSLTRYLACQARQVVAVELDERLIPLLQTVLEEFPNVKIVQGDILDFNPAELVNESGYLVVANIPYYITSALIRHLLETSQPPRQIILTIQREVAQRICASPGDLSLLALSVQVYGQPDLATYIPAGAFYPSPQVDSAVVRIALYPTPIIARALLNPFFRLIKAGFSQKRKTLRNSLSGGLGWHPPQAEALLAAAGINSQRRAETLSLEEWKRLVDCFAGNC
jgi:16S rRNA (adenine1518-N6/adenine1519-N6)-dimethyltransferase